MTSVLSRRQRERLVSLVFVAATITAAALVVGCSRQTASKWVGRARRGEGLAEPPNGKAERFIRTLLELWACAQPRRA